MKDIRIERFYHAKAFQVQRVGDTVAVNALQRDGGQYSTPPFT